MKVSLKKTHNTAQQNETKTKTKQKPEKQTETKKKQKQKQKPKTNQPNKKQIKQSNICIVAMNFVPPGMW